MLFAGSVGRTDLPFGDWETLLDSIRRSPTLPAATLVYPGHGPETTLGDELARTRFSPSSARPEARGAARHSRHPSRRAAALAAGHRELERLCALYGYRRIQTPGFEDTELFQRTSGEGSDVVQKEMYTFADRGGRSLTLRPEGTAPICRAYLEHGLHREPQPQKLYTSRRCTATAAPDGALSRALAVSVEAIGSDDPALDAEVIQLYDTLLRGLGVTQYELELNSIGDRACRPAYVERLTAWLDDASSDSTRTRARSRARTRCARSTTSTRSPRACRSSAEAPDDRRLALRRLRRALRGGAPFLDGSASRTRSCRRSSAGSTTTRARPGSSSARWTAPVDDLAAADATTG